MNKIENMQKFAVKEAAQSQVKGGYSGLSAIAAQYLFQVGPGGVFATR